MPTPSTPQVVSFDCYGTLVDWEAGIKETIAEILRGKGADHGLVEEMYWAREDIEFGMIQGPYRSYKDILHDSLSEAFERWRVPYSPEDGDLLVRSVPDWPIFPDTRPALKRLAEKRRLAIISNIDNDIIEKTAQKLGVEFSLIQTAQEAQAYKPSTKPFKMALKRLGCRPSHILHVSSGFRYDIPPAQKVGFGTAWVNRKSDSRPETAKPDQEFNNLAQLAEFLG